MARYVLMDTENEPIAISYHEDINGATKFLKSIYKDLDKNYFDEQGFLKECYLCDVVDSKTYRISISPSKGILLDSAEIADNTINNFVISMHENPDLKFCKTAEEVVDFLITKKINHNHTPLVYRIDTGKIVKYKEFQKESIVKYFAMNLEQGCQEIIELC